jgi:hypothetical protein
MPSELFSKLLAVQHATARIPTSTRPVWLYSLERRSMMSEQVCPGCNNIHTVV